MEYCFALLTVKTNKPRGLITGAVGCLLQALVVIGAPASANAADLTYTPVNPNFGGSPLNGSFLLNQAAANNSDRKSVV